jgi:hypothetical protein
VARYVLLAIDDDKAATALVKQIQKWKGVNITIPSVTLDTTGEIVPDVEVEVKATVRGVWARPSTFCECAGATGGFSRGTKLGWWVHTVCGKPSKLWAQGHDWYRSLGTNLLPISVEAPDWRGPNHTRHPGYTPDVPETGVVAAWLQENPLQKRK